VPWNISGNIVTEQEIIARIDVLEREILKVLFATRQLRLDIAADLD